MSQQQHDETTMTQHTQTHNRRALSRYFVVVLFSKMENNHQNLVLVYQQWESFLLRSTDSFYVEE